MLLDLTEAGSRWAIVPHFAAQLHLSDLLEQSVHCGSASDLLFVA